MVEGRLEGDDPMHRRALALPVLVATAALLAGCVPPSGPLTLEQVNAEFAEPIEPAWEVEVPGIYGEPAILDDLIAVYATDDEVGLRLEVRSAEDGELLWDVPASPGGAWGAPLFEETDSVSRAYPIPSIQPLLLNRGEGEDARAVVIYFERDVVNAEDHITPDDYLHVADARTGEELELTIPGFQDFNLDQYFSLHYLTDADDPFEATEGTIVAVPYSPGRVCGDGPTVCFEEPMGGYIELDLASLEVGVSEPEFSRDYTPEWGPGFARFNGAETTVARVEGGQVLWERTSDDLFADEYTRPPSLVDFIPAGELTLIQGYQTITQTPELGNQLDLDYTTSRRVVAVDTETGATVWTLEGGDAHCFAVKDYPRDPAAEVLPMCLATGGFFSYHYDDDEMLDEQEPLVSIVGVNVADGSIEWEIEHAGELSIYMVARQIEWTFAQGSRYSPVYLEEDTTGVADLRTGEVVTSVENATFLCESERPGVDLTYDEGGFIGGRSSLALEYPAGWFAFPCDDEGGEADWSRGSVRVGGYGDGERRIVVTEDGMAGFRL